MVKHEDEIVGIDPKELPSGQRAWLVRGGRDGETMEHNIDCNVITLGWGNWVANAPISVFTKREELRDHIAQFYEERKEDNADWSEGHKVTAVADIWSFTNEINIGDYVVLPSHGLPRGKAWLMIGEVTGRAVRDPNQPKGAKLFRKVDWRTAKLPTVETQIKTAARRWAVLERDLDHVRNALQGDCLSGDEAGVLPNDLTLVPSGAKTRVEVNRYERSSAARTKCLEHYNYTCQACGLKFEERYGEFAKEYMHAHHKVPLSQIEDHDNYEIDPTVDLVAVCPNCHAMLHYHPDKPCDVDTLRRLMQETQGGT